MLESKTVNLRVMERERASTPDVDNIVSQRVLGKDGFMREGIIRKSDFSRGEWKDGCLYSILREEWKEPRKLTKAT